MIFSQRVPITIRLNAFEGPLDLLLYLIQSHELHISQVSLTQMTDQYLSSIQLMQELNFDIASEFLVMAATLLYWKSRSLLPQEAGLETEKEETPALDPAALVQQLLQHQRFLEAGSLLSQRPLEGIETFVRPNRTPPLERVWKPMDVSFLALGYQEILVRSRKRTQILQKETVSLSDKIKELALQLPWNELIQLRALLKNTSSLPEVVATFLASLELARLKKVSLYQEGTYSDIYLKLLEAIQDFDLQFAIGFDTLETQQPS